MDFVVAETDGVYGLPTGQYLHHKLYRDADVCKWSDVSEAFVFCDEDEARKAAKDCGGMPIPFP